MTDREDITLLLRVKEVFSYDPLTGLLSRKIACGRKGRIGPVKGTLEKSGYLKIGLDGKQYFAHRLAWAILYGNWPKDSIDHINNIKHDNRLENLRAATTSENGANRFAQNNNKSGFKGVSAKGKGYVANIRLHGKQVYLGYSTTKEEASKLYKDAAAKYHGEFAKF